MSKVFPDDKGMLKFRELNVAVRGNALKLEKFRFELDPMTII